MQTRVLSRIDDVRAAVNFAREHHPGEPVALLGVSLGGAAALLASPLPIDALIVESAFPTISEAIHNRIPAALGPLRCVPAWLLLAPVLALAVPLAAKVLDRFDRAKDFTVGYHVTATRA